MMATTFHRLVQNALSRWALVLMSSSVLLWGCIARAPEFDHPYLPNLVSSDWFNFTITYEMTDDERARDAIVFKYSNDGFPFLRYAWLYARKRAEIDYAHEAISWSDTKATWWRFQVFDQTGTRICPKDAPEWTEVGSTEKAELSCGPVLKDHQGKVNNYVTLELDYVLSGDPNKKGTNHLTLGHVLRLDKAS